MSHSDPLVYVRHMLDFARELRDATAGRSRADLDTDRTFEIVVIHLLEVMGEASSRVPGSFRIRHPYVAWRATSDMRNRLIHGYDTIDHNVVWFVVQSELPPLIDGLEAVIEAEG